MDLAIIKTGGKQYIVRPGKQIKIEKIGGKNEGDKIAFDKVLLCKKDEKVKIGTPFVEQAKVEGEIIEQGRDRKIIILKYKSKTRRKTKRGHRQTFMKARIDKITIA